MPTPSATAKQLDRIESAILGNGHEGLIARTARIEEQTKSIDEKVDAAAQAAKEAKLAASDAAVAANEAVTKAAESITDLASVVKQLDFSVQAHHNTDHLSTLIRKKEFWAALVVIYIILHVVATYVPNVWDGIMTLVGLPKLILPIP